VVQSTGGYTLGVRNALNQKGISNERIGYDPTNGVTVDGQSFLRPAKTYQGTAYSSPQDFNNAWQQYSKPKGTPTSSPTQASGQYRPSVPSYAQVPQTGYQPQQTQQQPSYGAYNPYTSTTSQNPYTSQADAVIKQLLNYGQNQAAFDPYSSSAYKAAEAQAQRAAQQSTRQAQESLGMSGFGRSSVLGERVAGINNDANEYLMTQVLPQIEAQEAARRQQEYNNTLQALGQLMNQQGRADQQVQQGFNNNLAITDRTGNYLPQGANEIIQQLLGLKGQAEQRGISAQDRAGLSSQADVLRNQLQGMGVDISNLGAGTSRANAMAGLPTGQRTLAGQQQDLANRQANLNAALQVGHQTGYNVMPTNDWAGLYRQVISGKDTGGNPLTRTFEGQQFDANQAQRTIDNNFRQAQADIDNKYQQGQLSLAEAQEARMQLQQDYDEAYRRYGIEQAGNKYSGMTPNQVLNAVVDSFGGVDEDGKKTGKIDPGRKKDAFTAIVDAGLSEAQTDQLLATAGFTKDEINKFIKELGSGE
jgi:hypothetical protein